jgi:hypothetical protein
MNQSIFILFTILLLTSCSTNKKNINDKTQKDIDNIIELYIYNYESDNELNMPIDSISVYSSSYEKSLELYKEIDSLEKQVWGHVYFSIFKLKEKKFSVIIDSTTVKVFKFSNNNYKKIESFDCDIGVYGIKLQKIDINTDGFKDVLIEIPSGGFFGSSYICMFYNPDSKSLVFDKRTELRDIELDLNKKQITSYSSMQSEKYYIDKYTFKLFEKRIDLGKTTDIEELENKVEISRYDSNGNLIRKDTLDEH